MVRRAGVDERAVVGGGGVDQANVNRVGRRAGADCAESRGHEGEEGEREEGGAHGMVTKGSERRRGRQRGGMGLGEVRGGWG